MRSEISCAAVLLGMMGIVATAAAGENTAIVAEKHGLSPIILVAQVAGGSTTAQKQKIRTALFGDGTATGSIVSGALVGGDPNLDIKDAFANYGLVDGSNQAALLRMGEVLNALGVPREASQIPSSNTTYNLNAHFNHFHVYVKPPVRVEIETSSNLLAAAPTSTATDARATSAPVPAATPKTKYDKVFSGCTYAVNADWSPSAIEMYNTMLPAATVSTYLSNRGILWGENEPVKITLLKSPAHGDLIPNARYPNGVFIYHANQGYLGIDQMSFEVEVLGKKFKVIYALVVQNSNTDGPTEEAEAAIKKCKQNLKGSSLDIIELPTEGFVSDEELAKLHSLVSFALGSGTLGNGGLSFADLPAGAVGQTVGQTITLDTNAAGHGWFVDTTPGDNSEYLPTSDPNIWQARAGTAAAGKMDMLSVLLHEYGHVLGIGHSADQHASMATTLTPSTRRLPSADEMALMSQLVGELKNSPLSNSLPTGERGQAINSPLTFMGEGQGERVPGNLPVAPFGGGLAALFLGRLRTTRFGGVSTVFDSAQLLPTVTQYAVAANAALTNTEFAASGAGGAGEGAAGVAIGWHTAGNVAFNGNGTATLFETASAHRLCSHPTNFSLTNSNQAKESYALS